MTLWVDAADASTFTLTGALVEQWNDKSGAGHHLTKSTFGGFDRRPTKTGNSVVYVTDGNNNNNKGLVSTEAFLGLVGNAYSYYVCWKRTADNDDYVIGNTGAIYAYLQYTLDRWIVGDNSAVVAMAAGAAKVKSARSDGLTELVRQTNLTAHASTAAAAGFSGATIGCSNTYAGPLAGTIYEVMCYSARLTDAQNLQNVSYLMNRWGVA